MNESNTYNHLLINPYHKDAQFRNFPDLDAGISAHYDRLYDSVVDFEISPRFFYETGLKIGFRDIFYYIDMLYDDHPEDIIDVGCGECIWKRWFPRIVGFDPNINEFSQQDFVDFFDAEFSKGHKEEWHSGMALNSVHFIPWQDLEKQISLVMDIVKHRFLFTFNFNSMKEVPAGSLPDQIQAFHHRIKDLGYDIIMFDAPTLRNVSKMKIDNWAYINGTVRFILEK